jgi:predicted DNA-binding transcriptional regulator
MTTTPDDTEALLDRVARDVGRAAQQTLPIDGAAAYVQDGARSTGYVEGSATSKAAHDRAMPRAGSRQATIYDLLVIAGERGHTSDEIEQRLEAPHQSVSAALTNMERSGLLRRIDVQRETRWGNGAYVYVTSVVAKSLDPDVRVLEPVNQRKRATS